MLSESPDSTLDGQVSRVGPGQARQCPEEVEGGLVWPPGHGRSGGEAQNLAAGEHPRQGVGHRPQALPGHLRHADGPCKPAGPQRVRQRLLARPSSRVGGRSAPPANVLGSVPLT